jgi:hypothetical protein
MKAESIFSICNMLAIAGWLLLISLPRWKWTSRIVGSGAISLLLGAVYLALVIIFFGRAEGGFGSLAEVAKLFEQPYVLLAGWVHYLAFDLFIGTWEVKDSQIRAVPHWMVVPCLVLTFLFGPIGLITYYIVRTLKGKKLSNGAAND